MKLISMLLLACIGVAGLGFISNLHAQDECTVANLQGDYGFSYDGVLLGDRSSIRGAAVGLVSLDGAGNISGADTVSLNGMVTRRTWTGTYTVSASCTGSARLLVARQPVNLDFVIADGGGEIQFIETDPRSVMTGVAKQTSAACTAASIQGSYAYSFPNGALFSRPDQPAQQVAIAGKLTTDGKDRVTGADTVSANGQIVRRTYTGTYTVAENCRGNASITDSLGTHLHLDFVITGEGDEVRLIVAAPGAVQVGVAKRQ